MTAPDQSLLAADPRRSAWVSANAGSGKTHTLANRVSRLLLDGAKPERILCLTFTKAAAAEMQGRLFEQLGRWSMLDDRALFAEIRDVGGEELDKLELRRARRLFAQALETPGGLKIQTIHSFCQHLLARFPLEADLSPSFEVLDEQTTRELIGEARARVLERAGKGDTQLSTAVSYLATHASEMRLKEILDNAIGKDRSKLENFLQLLAESGESLAAAIRRAHEAGDESYEKLAEDFSATLRQEEQRLRETIAWLSSGGANDKGRAQILEDFLAIPPSVAAYEKLRGAFLAGGGEIFKNLALTKLQTARPDLAEYLSALAAHLRATDERCRAAKASGLAEAALTVAQAVLKEYTSEKHNRGVLDYDDLIAETLDLLEQTEAAAWVLYKLDGGLDHILIDEAQDTSPAQWKIVKKLAEEFFAGEGADQDRGRLRTIFAVGDEKQSIFSFQGADPAEFGHNRHYFEDHAQQAEREFSDVRLTKSRRSAPEILKFVDEVFKDTAAREGLTSEDVAISHDAFREQAEGRVELWPTLKSAKNPKLDSWLVPIDAEAPESPVVQLADQIARQIKTWTDGKTKLPGHDEPIRPGDVMILLPRRDPFATEIIRHLKDRGVPVAGADRLKITEQIAVMDLMALGHFALLPEDDLNLAALLRSPLIDLSEAELFSLCRERRQTLWNEIIRRQDELLLSGVHTFLQETLARGDFAPPFEFYAHILGAKGMRAKLLARLGAEADDAVNEFLSLALDYEALNTPSLEGFLHWIDRGEPEIKRDMERGRDEIRVLTVHGAKGLEADIVILPDTTTLPDGPGRRGELIYTADGVIYPIRNERASRAVLRAKREALAEVHREHRRLLYVALTRARDRLIVCGFENLQGAKPGCWHSHAERAAKAVGAPYQAEDEERFAVGRAALESAAPKLAAARTQILPDWAQSPAQRERESPRIIRPSEAIGLEEVAPSPISKSAQRFRRGLLVHAMLARLPEVAPEERASVARTFLAARGVEADDADALVKETLAVIEGRDFAAAFSPQARAETAIVAELPELGEDARVAGRLDRIVVTDDTVFAIDFKTNRPPPARVEDVAALYLTQMALYREALRKVFPTRRIASALVWTEGPSLMPLPDDVLDGEILKIRQRLAAEGTRLDPREGRS
jgi:ATP-dependent helicase/nuclease subunit A